MLININKRIAGLATSELFLVCIYINLIVLMIFLQRIFSWVFNKQVGLFFHLFAGNIFFKKKTPATHSVTGDNYTEHIKFWSELPFSNSDCSR